MPAQKASTAVPLRSIAMAWKSIVSYSVINIK